MLLGISSIIERNKYMTERVSLSMGGRCPRFNLLKMTKTVKKLKFESLFGSHSYDSDDSSFESEW